MQPQQPAQNLSVTGFGACMIAGYPLSIVSGFLHQAIERLHHSGTFSLTYEIIAMGGFPAHRAAKHLAKKVLIHRPDVVVVQFGSTDASAPLRNNFISRRRTHSAPRAQATVSATPPNSGDVFKWQLRNFASELLMVPPQVPLEIYVGAVLKMVEECRAAGSRVVVVSPFVMGGGRSDRFARRYTRELRKRLPPTPEVRFLDAHSLLSRWPRREMLLQDGFHLSAEAHKRLGSALAEVIIEIVRHPVDTKSAA